MPPPFRHEMRVRYADCDMQGVVFNANYLTYFDTTVTELWREAVGPYERMLETGTDMVVAEARVRYLAPARFDDELEIAAEIARFGTTSMVTRLEVRRTGEDSVLAEGELRQVFIDAGEKTKKPIPDDVRRALEPYAAAGATAAA